MIVEHRSKSDQLSRSHSFSTAITRSRICRLSSFLCSSRSCEATISVPPPMNSGWLGLSPSAESTDRRGEMEGEAGGRGELEDTRSGWSAASGWGSNAPDIADEVLRLRDKKPSLRGVATRPG